MNPMHVGQTQFQPGNIVIREQLPSLTIGRNVLATVLSRPKDGMVLVSLFGKRLLVETDMALTKGQTLNLKVEALNPKIILKAVETPSMPRSVSGEGIMPMIEQLVGKFEDVPLKSFNIREILEDHLAGKHGDAATANFAATLIDEAAKYPQALAFLLIPIVQDQSRGRAKVIIEPDPGHGYMITFDMETDHMGIIGCSARIGNGIEVEIRTGSDALADFIRSYLSELHTTLSSLDTVKRLEVVMKRMPQASLDMLV